MGHTDNRWRPSKGWPTLLRVVLRDSINHRHRSTVSIRRVNINSSHHHLTVATMLSRRRRTISNTRIPMRIRTRTSTRLNIRRRRTTVKLLHMLQLKARDREWDRDDMPSPLPNRHTRGLRSPRITRRVADVVGDRKKIRMRTAHHHLGLAPPRTSLDAAPRPSFRAKAVLAGYPCDPSRRTAPATRFFPR